MSRARRRARQRHRRRRRSARAELVSRPGRPIFSSPTARSSTTPSQLRQPDSFTTGSTTGSRPATWSGSRSTSARSTIRRSPRTTTTTSAAAARSTSGAGRAGQRLRRGRADNLSARLRGHGPPRARSIQARRLVHYVRTQGGQAPDRFRYQVRDTAASATRVGHDRARVRSARPAASRGRARSSPAGRASRRRRSRGRSRRGAGRRGPAASVRSAVCSGQMTTSPSSRGPGAGAGAVDREGEHVGGLVLAPMRAVELADPLLADELDREVPVRRPPPPRASPRPPGAARRGRRRGRVASIAASRSAYSP